MLIHGGGWSSGDQRLMHPLADYLAAHGLWTVSENGTIERGDGLENGYSIHTTGRRRACFIKMTMKSATCSWTCGSGRTRRRGRHLVAARHLRHL